MYSSLHLRHKDLSVPFNFWGDITYVLANVSAIIHTGWYWSNPLLSAPFGCPLIAFPQNASVDYTVVWLVARFSSNPGLVLNISWLLFFFLGGASAFYCLRQFRIESSLAMLFGTVYAFLPFAFYVAHLPLSFYLVPFACTLALSVASGTEFTPQFRKVSLIGCLFLGFNYIYNAFFCVVTIAAAFLIAVLRGRAAERWRLAALAIVLTCTGCFINLAPSLRFWHEHGKPFEEYKSARDSEVYGLKIRYLISPVATPRTWLGATWRRWEAEANFPNELESSMARLGMIPSVGFLLLLCTIFVPRWVDVTRDKDLLAAAQLNLALLLVGTVGGFSALFSMLVSPAIRGYDRLVVFIAFYTVFALAFLFHAPWPALPASIQTTYSRRSIVCAA